ncbi:hypothetical protein [Orientia tsutsugamushi]|nr:hypothetical protein [Orientia tsutsugamushi]
MNYLNQFRKRSNLFNAFCIPDLLTHSRSALFILICVTILTYIFF